MRLPWRRRQAGRAFADATLLCQSDRARRPSLEEGKLPRCGSEQRESILPVAFDI
jgi:hypothetical protein